jgi:hypothetical protein
MEVTMVRYIRTDELYHHGTKGMRWGFRRYQNPDGSYTEEGKRRRLEAAGKGIERSIKREIAKKKFKDGVDRALTQNVKGGKDKPNISPAEKITKDARNIVTETSNIAQTIANLKRMRNKEDVSTLTDDELRARINRLNLETQYNNLSAKRVQTGFDTASEILTAVGSVVGIVGSTVAIAATVHNWNK